MLDPGVRTGGQEAQFAVFLRLEVYKGRQDLSGNHLNVQLQTWDTSWREAQGGACGWGEGRSCCWGSSTFPTVTLKPAREAKWPLMPAGYGETQLDSDPSWKDTSQTWRPSCPTMITNGHVSGLDPRLQEIQTCRFSLGFNQQNPECEKLYETWELVSKTNKQVARKGGGGNFCRLKQIYPPIQWTFFVDCFEKIQL